MQERRKNQRVKTVNLLSYACFDKASKPLEQGTGKTLNMSLGGLLMETHVPVQAKYILLMAINLKEELIEIKGKVVFCKESESKTFHTGIRFTEKNEKIRGIVTDMLRFFLKTYSESRIAITTKSLSKM